MPELSLTRSRWRDRHLCADRERGRLGAQIAAAEGEKLVAYQDVGGVWTICHGHTGPECAGASARVMRGVELGTGSI